MTAPDEFSRKIFSSGALTAAALPDLPAELRRLLQQIPAGRAATYGDLAEALGDRSAARWVGEYLVDHPHDANCRCHRVVRVNGDPGLSIEGDPEAKLARLREEGVPVSGGRVELSKCRVAGFDGARPLTQLLRFQEEIAQRALEIPLSAPPDRAAGVDVSYQGAEATGAYVEVDVATREVVRRLTLTRPVPFPYIPGYLTFRELPVLLEVIRAAEREGPLAPVIFVDGNGMLHPRRAGIGTALGVILDRATVGVSKSLLLGRVNLDLVSPESAQPVLVEGQPLGMALRAKAESRPIFVSVGHRIRLEEAVDLARRLFAGHRLPEPVYWADRLSRDAALRGAAG